RTNRTERNGADLSGISVLPVLSTYSGLLPLRRPARSSEVIRHRHLQPPRQNRPGEKDRAGGHQPGVAFLEPLSLECVQQVDVDGRAGAERIPGPEVEIVVG